MTISKITQHTLSQMEELVGEKLTLGRLLWAIRQSEEMTQVEFANLLDISKQHLCDLEHNRKIVRPKLAANYAEKLGYSSEQFVRLCLQDMLDRDGINLTINTCEKSANDSQIDDDSAVA